MDRSILEKLEQELLRGREGPNRDESQSFLGQIDSELSRQAEEAFVAARDAHSKGEQKKALNKLLQIKANYSDRSYVKERTPEIELLFKELWAPKDNPVFPDSQILFLDGTDVDPLAERADRPEKWKIPYGKAHFSAVANDARAVWKDLGSLVEARLMMRIRKMDKRVLVRFFFGQTSLECSGDGSVKIQRFGSIKTAKIDLDPATWYGIAFRVDLSDPAKQQLVTTIDLEAAGADKQNVVTSELGEKVQEFQIQVEFPQARPGWTDQEEGPVEIDNLFLRYIK